LPSSLYWQSKFKDFLDSPSIEDSIHFFLTSAAIFTYIAFMPYLYDKFKKKVTALEEKGEHKISLKSLSHEAYNTLNLEAEREKANFVRLFSKDEAIKKLDDILYEHPQDSLSYYLRARIYADKEKSREYISDLYHMLITFSEKKDEREKATRILKENWHHELIYLGLFSSTKKPRFKMKRCLEATARGVWNKEKNRPRSIFRDELRPLLREQYPKSTLDFLEALVTENEYYKEDSKNLEESAKKEAKELYYKAFAELTQAKNFHFREELDSTNQVFMGKIPSLPNVLFIGKTNKQLHELKQEYDFLRRIHGSFDVVKTSSLPYPFYFGKIGDRFFLIERFLDGKLLYQVLENPHPDINPVKKSLKALVEIDEALSSNYFIFGSNLIPLFDYKSELAKRIDRAPNLAPHKDIIMESFSPILEEIQQLENQICHGDPHSRNFVVAYDDVKLLDFEKLTWANPFYDICYFLEQPDISKNINNREEFGQEVLGHKAFDFSKYPLMASYIDLLQTVRSSSWYSKRQDEQYLELEKYFRSRAIENLNHIKGNFSSLKKKKLEGLVEILEKENK
jgi:aminoglycoside phosphotransferase (APT) family kinase protein